MFILPIIMIAMVVCIYYDSMVFSNHYVREFLYSISLSIQELLMFILPIIIFSLISQSIANLSAKKAIKMVAVSIIVICLSNFLSCIIAYVTGFKLFSIINIPNLEVVKTDIVQVNRLWNIGLPHIMNNGQAILLGIIFGLLVSFSRLKFLISPINKLSKASIFFLQKVFIPLVPVFVLGFILKMSSEGILGSLTHYLILIMIVFAIIYSYIIFLYGVGSCFSFKKWMSAIANMLPSSMVAFCSMSSIVAIPSTLLSTEKNVGRKNSQFIVPIAVNIHLIGDCFFIIMLSFAMFHINSFHEINFYELMMFIGYFVLSRFATAAVPGIGIIVVLPMIEQYLHLSSTEMSVVTALYIIFDPLIAFANVLGNGALAIILSKFYKKYTSN